MLITKLRYLNFINREFTTILNKIINLNEKISLNKTLIKVQQC